MPWRILFTSFKSVYIQNFCLIDSEIETVNSFILAVDSDGLVEFCMKIMILSKKYW